MTITLTQYGMDRAVENSPGSQFIKISGTTNLYSCLSGPSGVLYRPIAKIEDAIELGGLILMNAAGTRWQFWVGGDLLDTMSWGQIGKRPVTNDARPTRLTLLVNEGFKLSANTGGAVILTQYNIRADARMNAAPTFTAGEVVHGFGIVTSATFGMGINGVSIGRCSSYMCTTEQMNVPFSKYLSDVKGAALMAIPSSIKKYYEDTFTKTVDALPSANQAASISVVTHWEGNALADLKDRSYTVLPFTSASDLYNFTTFASLFGYGMPAAEAIATLKSDNPGTPLGAVNTSYGTGCGIVGTENNAANIEYVGASMGPRKLYLYDGPGCVPVADQYSNWKGFAMCCVERSLPTTRSHAIILPHNGTVGNLSCGVIRDGHTLERSINQGIKNSSELSLYGNLAELVKAQMGGRSREYSPPIVLSSVGDATTALATAALSRGLRYTSVVNRGNLADFIERFNDAWDLNAEVAAKAV